jgi:hypothetical protein
MSVPDCCPESGQITHITCEWEGQLKRKHLPEYRQWILLTNQLLADRLGKAASVRTRNHTE